MSTYLVKLVNLSHDKERIVRVEKAVSITTAERAALDHAGAGWIVKDSKIEREGTKRASYRAGIFWIASNDDTQWLNDGPNAHPSVTACLLADLFGVSTEKLTEDLRRELKKLGRAS